VTLKETRLRTDQTRADWQVDLAGTLNKTAVVLEALGRFPEAEEAFNREHELLRAAVGKQPDNRRWVQRLGASHSFLGNLYDQLGAGDRALDQFRREEAIETQLVTHDPENKEWQRDLAATEARIARLLRNRGDLRAAEEHQRRALTRLEPLVAKDAGRARWRRDVAGSHAALALIRLDRGDPVDASRHLRTAQTLIEALPDDDRVTRRMRWRVTLAAGTVAARGGDEAAARRHWASVADELWPLRTTLPVKDLDFLCRALLLLGRVEDAAPIVARLDSTGYRLHDLVVLWNARSVIVNRNRNRAEAQKGF
jgi:tetratricopeptide (TPR) repeat protein